MTRSASKTASAKKNTGRAGRAPGAPQVHAGVVEVYSREDGTTGIDALVPASVAHEMLGAIAATDIEDEFTRRGMTFLGGNDLAASHPPRFDLFQASVGGMVAIDAELSPPTAALVLMLAHKAGVTVRP
jgi:hypothetical protein